MPELVLALASYTTSRGTTIDNEITCLASLGEPELVSRLQGYFDEAAL